MAIKLYYNKTTYQLITFDDGGESLIKGDKDSKSFEFYFGTGTELADFVLDATIPLTYEGRVTFKRADDETTNEVYLTPIAGGFYRYVIGDWVTEVEGELKITTRLKLGAAVTNFGIATHIVEDGVAPDDGSTISQLQYDAIMGTVNDVIIGTTPIAYDNTVSGLAAVDVQGAIDEVDADVDALDVRVTTAEDDIDLLEGRATVLETFKDTTVPATYETISNVDIVRGRVTAVESGKEDVVDANAHRVRTTDLETAAMFKHVSWDSTTGVITFTRYDDTTETVDLPTEMIFDTVVYDDANMQLVFTLKNGTSFTVPIDDILTGIATEDWVVLNYYNKTQGDARYVTKDITAYTNLTAEENKTSARIYVDDNGTPKKMTLGEIYEGANTAAGAFVPNGVYDDLTVGYAKKSESGIDIDTEFTTIDGRLDTVEGDIANIKSGTQNIAYNNTISELTATTVKGAIDEIDGRLDNSEADILELQEEVLIPDTATLATGEAVTSMPVGTLDGTVDNMVIEGNLLDAPQLITNGDFASDVVSWTATNGVNSWSSGYLINTGSGASIISDTYQTITGLDASTGIFYLQSKVRITNALTPTLNLTLKGSISGGTLLVAGQTSAVANQWYYLSGIINLSGQGLTGNPVVRQYQLYADTTDANGAVMEVDYAYAFNISTLIANKQYSPLYNTTFDLMSDAQIKAQMDLWVQDGTLPSEIRAVNAPSMTSKSEDETKTSTISFPSTELYRLPNGVHDSIDYHNGEFTHTQRVQKYTLQESDIVNMRTTYTNLDYARVKILDITSSGIGIAFSENYDNYVPLTSFDDINAIGKLVTNAEELYIWVGLVKGTTLTEAQTDLAGTDIYYQLATPIPTTITPTGELMAYENGTLYIDGEFTPRVSFDVPVNLSAQVQALVTSADYQAKQIKALTEIIAGF